jgi:16S rRNA processing protein RimM
MQPALKWTLLARILGPQGRKGEVLADLFTDFPERFASRPDVWLAPAGFIDALETGADRGPEEPQASKVIAHWLPVGRNAGRIVLHFAGVDSISAAELLTRKEVVVPLEARMPLEGGAVYISDLVGCAVYDDGELVGTVSDVQFATTADGTRRLDDAAPLLVLQSPGGHEILVPFVNEYLSQVDTEARSIEMRLPEGLTQVNRADTE